MIFTEITDINLNYWQTKGKNNILKIMDYRAKFLSFSDNLIIGIFDYAYAIYAITEHYFCQKL